METDRSAASGGQTAGQGHMTLPFSFPARLEARKAINPLPKVSPPCHCTVIRFRHTTLGEIQTEGFFYHLSDALGSVRQLATTSGAVTGTAQYAPYGGVLSGQGNVSAYGFAGEWQDTGLHKFIYLRARYYAPYLNRWIQPDTIVPNPGNPQDLNRFAYARGNPLRYTDPTGHLTKDELRDNLGFTDQDAFDDWWDNLEKSWQDAMIEAQWGSLLNFTTEAGVSFRLVLSKLADGSARHEVTDDNLPNPTIGFWDIDRKRSMNFAFTQTLFGQRDGDYNVIAFGSELHPWSSDTPLFDRGDDEFAQFDETFAKAKEYSRNVRAAMLAFVDLPYIGPLLNTMGLFSAITSVDGLAVNQGDPVLYIHQGSPEMYYTITDILERCPGCYGER